MNEWHPPVQCPQCGSEDTCFIEPNYEMSIFECNACGCRFEIEEDA
jgi:transcription elongation factor Elf1